MTIDAESQQRWNQECMLTSIPAATKLLLDPALNLKSSGPNDGAAVGYSWSISIDQIWLISTLQRRGVSLFLELRFAATHLAIGSVRVDVVTEAAIKVLSILLNN